MGLFSKSVDSGSLYDKVELIDESGNALYLTRDAYEKLPHAVRTTAIVKNRVRYFKGDREVDADEVFGIGKYRKDR